MRRRDITRGYIEYSEKKKVSKSNSAKVFIVPKQTLFHSRFFVLTWLTSIMNTLWLT